MVLPVRLQVRNGFHKRLLKEISTQIDCDVARTMAVGFGLVPVNRIERLLFE